MKEAIETARLRKQRTSELADEARHAQERYDLYKAKTYGPTMTSPAKLRELKQACELSDARLRSAWVAPGSPESAAGDRELV
jgi:hypothetical protein